MVRIKVTSGDPFVKEAKKKEKEKMPKKPRSSYLYYCEATRDDLKKEHPDLSMTELAKLLGEGWHSLVESEKAKYVAAAGTDKERYEREMEEGGFKKEPAEPKPKKPRKSKKEANLVGWCVAAFGARAPAALAPRRTSPGTDACEPCRCEPCRLRAHARRCRRLAVRAGRCPRGTRCRRRRRAPSSSPSTTPRVTRSSGGTSSSTGGALAGARARCERSHTHTRLNTRTHGCAPTHTRLFTPPPHTAVHPSPPHFCSCPKHRSSRLIPSRPTPPQVRERNTNKRLKIDGDHVNFYVYYAMDDNLSKHVLELEG
jgi:hypothetical protein